MEEVKKIDRALLLNYFSFFFVDRGFQIRYFLYSISNELLFNLTSLFMKRTFFLTLAMMGSFAVANAASLVADYAFDGNLTNSVGGALGSWSSGCTVTYGDKGMTMDRTGQYSGLHNVNASSVGNSWALSLDINLAGIGGNYQQILKLGSDTPGSSGLMLVAGNGAGDWGSGFGLASANSHNDRAMSNISVKAGEWNNISLISMDGTVRMYLNGTDITSSLTKTAGNGIEGLNLSLDQLKLGYNNSAGDYGVKNGTGFDDLKIWSVGQGDTLNDVLMAMGMVPEPGTASLGLLALSGMLFRRRVH